VTRPSSARMPFVRPGNASRRVARRFLGTLLVTLIAAALGAARARATALGAPSDSVAHVNWTLPNGMRVLAQHIPDGRGIAISVAYPGGSDQDPPARPGLASLLAEVHFTAAASDVPERARSEMSSLRPYGYEVRVGRSITIFTEVATPMQFAGVLHQIATRMRGVQVTPALLAAALENVRTRHHREYLDAPDIGLYNEVTERASGVDDAGIQRLVSLSAIAKLDAKEVQSLDAKAFSSRHAVISIAGNLDGLNLRALLTNEFSGVPGGPPAPLPPIRPGRGAVVTVKHDGVHDPVGVLGVMAPALSDSSHAAFYLAALIVGAQANLQWGDPTPPLSSRFQYSILEDPDLVRFYPPLKPNDREAGALSFAFAHGVGGEDNLVVSDDVIENLRSGVNWLVGGPLHAAVLARMRTQSGALILLTNSMVERELRGGEAFWSVYRRRMEEAGAPDFVYWLGRMREPKHQVALLYLPR
jgi:predicted Zn-dependent peptidase